ncbi:P-loop containing nucleoside triphosphate hydrolase protein [Mycena belliarum]|uniref:RNA helicase n=1 Tax=Mycena belliarum TaxID=1033014 RepID=A0AAD6U4W7_9AGAR|nr:P-loop containing nucleoside triphosphate hydrolase protein [Mycena belliae]
MQGFSVWLRRPCIANSRSTWTSYQSIGRRFRSSTSHSKRPARPSPTTQTDGFQKFQRPGRPPQTDSIGFQGLRQADASPETILTYFRLNVETWSKQRAVHDRFVSFGAPLPDISRLLVAFVRDAQKGVFDSPDAMEQYGLKRLSDTDNIEADIAFSHIFTRWLLARPAPVKGVEPETVERFRRISEAITEMHPAELLPATRQMRRRVIMHVGPTNSGKTHHALRALAAAPAGVYAGPLRLLAYEIWERLNMGHIPPLGATPEQIAAATEMGPSPDNPFARMCDMITGEEQKLVVPHNSPGLVSCTVEMCNTMAKFDVAVIDEIQMIADSGRGWAWTRAVLGIRATELHLCGEETAVPLITEMLKDTGDELIIKKYARLTPLEVEKKSLDNDLRNVRKGDCIVAFSRTSIFTLKRDIEMQTGLKCAVVYGKLPPEIRSEQAALFNDPDSGYDVLIGSDAIGMGLNLKIRRVIFESVRKFDGRAEKLLSTSSMKQIAGRAGRFGLHRGDEAPGGYVTTLRPEDLPVLRRTLQLEIMPLKAARITLEVESLNIAAAHLPPRPSTETILLAVIHLGGLPLCYRHTYPERFQEVAAFIDSVGMFTLAEACHFMTAPFPWRDPLTLDAVRAFIVGYYERMHVDVMVMMRELPYLAQLEDAEAAHAAMDGRRAKHLLHGLEMLHRLLTSYMWLALRKPVAYPSYTDATTLKERCERVLHWCLRQVTLRSGDVTAASRKPPIRYVSKQDRMADLRASAS